MPKITKVQELEKLLRACQDGCHKLRIERDAAVRERNEAIICSDFVPRQRIVANPDHKCPAPSRWYGESPLVDICMLMSAVFIGSILGLWVGIHSVQKIEIPHQTFLMQIPKWMIDDYQTCQAHDKAAVEAWKQDERRLTLGTSGKSG